MLKKVWGFLFFSSLSLAPFYKGLGQELAPKVITGDFYYTEHPSSKIKFLPNNRYAVFLDSVNMFESWGKAVYDISYKNDTAWLTVTYHKANVNRKWVRNYKERSAIWLKGDYLTTVSYKTLKGITKHIDEYALLVKKTSYPRKIEITRPLICYIIPDNYKGDIWIAFNQEDGVAPEYDSLGNAILKIPENGLLRTTLHEDVFATANGHFRFQREGVEHSVEVFKTYNVSQDFDSTCCIDNKPIVLVYGYNQTSREDINDNIFGRTIKGNVLSFYFGNYKDIEENRYFPKKTLRINVKNK